METWIPILDGEIRGKALIGIAISTTEGVERASDWPLFSHMQMHSPSLPLSVVSCCSSSSRYTRGKKARSRSRAENSPFLCRAEPRVIRVPLRLEAPFPTDASRFPTSTSVQASVRCSLFRSSLFVLLSVVRLELRIVRSLSFLK